MKQTEYFKRRVLQERPYIRLERCEAAVREPETTGVQPDGRVRHWRFVPELGKHLRVVTLPTDRRSTTPSPTARSSRP